MSTVEKPRGWEAPGKPGAVERVPAWKDAVVAFLEEGFAPGSVVTHDWLYGHFGVLPPSKCKGYEAIRSSQLMYLQHLECFKRELLEEHQIALSAARGKGYYVVPPSEQTLWAEETMKADLRKALRTGKNRLVNIRMDELSDEQKKENLDARARLSFFRKQTRKAIF